MYQQHNNRRIFLSSTAVNVSTRRSDNPVLYPFSLVLTTADARAAAYLVLPHPEVAVVLFVVE